MASIRKRNSRWEVRVRRSGYPTQTKTFTHKSSAQMWAREAELALEVPAANVAGAVGRQQCRVAPACDDSPDAEPRDRLDAPRPRHEVRALAVPRDDVLVRVAELADAVVAPCVHVRPGEKPRSWRPNATGISQKKSQANRMRWLIATQPRTARRARRCGSRRARPRSPGRRARRTRPRAAAARARPRPRRGPCTRACRSCTPRRRRPARTCGRSPRSRA